jgi:hypothetical protein
MKFTPKGPHIFNRFLISMGSHSPYSSSYLISRDMRYIFEKHFLWFQVLSRANDI